MDVVGIDRDGKPVEMGGGGTLVSRRQPDGTWRIVLDDPLSPE
jgi:ketosteroid isomerase-like protein